MSVFYSEQSCEKLIHSEMQMPHHIGYMETLIPHGCRSVFSKMRVF